MTTDEVSFRRLLAKWSGYAYLKKKLKSWRARRVAGQGFTKEESIVSVSGYKVHPSYESSLPRYSRYSLNDDYPFQQDDRRFSEPTSPVHLSDGNILRDILVTSVGSSIPKAVSEVSRGQYIFQRLLGSGSFSKVKLAIDQSTGEKVAIKMIDAREVRGSARLQQTLVREVEILREIRHPNIVGFREVTLIRDYVCLIMDYVTGVELFHHVAARKRLTENDASIILRQLLLALRYLHQRGVAHRDLKLENILVDVASDGRLTVTLVDFGLARMMREEGRGDGEEGAREGGFLLTTRCGSEEYAAPEVIVGTPYDGRFSDMWSFGVVMYACLTGSLPFNPETGRPRILSEKIVTVTYKLPDDLMSPGAAQIIKALLVKEPMARITISELLRHPWFAL